MKGNRVVRVEEDVLRGTFTLQGHCGLCPWLSDRVKAVDQGSDRMNAPVTNQVARKLEAHHRVKHPRPG